MSAGPSSAPRRQLAPSRSAPFLMGSALFTGALYALGAVAIWPIYRSAAYAILAVSAFAIALLIALTGVRRRWSALRLTLVTAAAYLVTVVPLAAPSMFTHPDAALLLSALTAPVTGWKEVLTLELPLGSYRATLAPALLLLLTAGVAGLSIAWRAARLWILMPPVLLALTCWGVVFGSSAVSRTASAGPVAIAGPRETAVAVAAVLVSVGFHAWRSTGERRRALRLAQSASGVRGALANGSAARGRIALSLAMVAIASVVGVALAPLSVADRPREVLRTQVDPRLDLVRTASPLATYRAYFTDEWHDTVLFTVEAGAAVDRVRLVALPFFDGQAARIVDPRTGDADQRTAFVRVPSVLPAPAATGTAPATVTIGAYDAPWLPLTGALTAISFDGPPALPDGFFYQRGTRTGIQLAALGSGTVYRQSAAIEAGPPATASLVPEGISRIDPELVPNSLVEWMRMQDAGTGGPALSTLIERLRARGFLSHALLADPETPPPWLGELAAFQPSRAGHSSDRIGQLFDDLVTRQNEVGLAGDAQLVATVGDDEQFAVAAAMIADRLGFAVRIVLGARLTDGDEDALPACEAGVCRGRNMTAWIEVRDEATGRWAPIDVTPQDRVAPFAPDEQRNDPENPTDVDAENAAIIPPLDANPTDTGDTDDERPADLDLGALWAVLGVVGTSLLGVLLLLSPVLVVLGIKLVRRRARRRAADPVAQVTGGWDEYVDAAVDHGHPAPRAATRQELAASFGAEDAAGDAGDAGDGILLATWADRTVFGGEAPSPDDADGFWLVVDRERERFDAGLGRWARLRARLSLRSLRRRPARGRRLS